MARSVAEIRRRDVFTLRQLAAVQVNQPPVAIAAARHDEDAPPLGLLEKLHAMRHLKYARAARGQATEHRVVFQKGALAILVQTLSPGLKRGDLAGVVQV